MFKEAKPAVRSGGHRNIFVSDWKPCNRNTLQAFLSLTLPSGLIIRNCTLHQKNGSRWIGLPGRQYAKDDRSTTYSAIVAFTTKDVQREFQAQALYAVDRFLESHHE